MQASIDLLEAKRRLGLNLTSNVLYLTVSVVFNIWFTPYLVRNLGIQVYGMVPLAISATSYMAIFTSGLNSATGRFLIIDLAGSNWRVANRTFNTALFGMGLISSILLPIVLGGAYAAPSFFKVPVGYETEVQGMFIFVGLAFLLTSASSTFAISTFAFNRFELGNLNNLLQLLARGCFVVCCFTILKPNLWQVGAGTLLAAITSLGGYVILWRKLTPRLNIKFADFDRSMFQDIISMASWVTINTAGGLLFLNSSLIVVNIIMGDQLGGQYGAVLQIPILLRTLGTTIAGVLSPVIITQYARDDLPGIVRVSRQALKLMGLGLALPVGLICGFARPLLELWLGSSFGSLDIVLIILTIHLCVNIAVTPLFSIQISTNQMRWPGITTLVTGVVNVILALLLARWTLWGLAGVVLAEAILLSLRNGVFTTAYCARLLRLPWWTFFPSLLWGAISVLGISLVSFMIAQIYVPDNWSSLIGVSFLIAVTYVVILTAFGMKDTLHSLFGKFTIGA